MSDIYCISYSYLAVTNMVEAPLKNKYDILFSMLFQIKYGL